MQCKVLQFDSTSSPVSQEAEINRWLALGWRIASTSANKYYCYVYLTR